MLALFHRLRDSSAEVPWEQVPVLAIRALHVPAFVVRQHAVLYHKCIHPFYPFQIIPDFILDDVIQLEPAVVDLAVFLEEEHGLRCLLVDLLVVGVGIFIECALFVHAGQRVLLLLLLAEDFAGFDHVVLVFLNILPVHVLDVLDELVRRPVSQEL